MAAPTAVAPARTDFGEVEVTGKVYSGSYANIVLLDPGTQETATITGIVSNSTGTDAILGTIAFPWIVNNSGTVAATGSTGNGIELLQGGAVNNQLAKALIEGYDGVLIKGAAGAVTNLGLIEATGTNGRGVLFTYGGSVVNGSAANTAATIAGVRNAVLIEGAAGNVTNFGTVTSSGTHATINLFEGGTVTNGSSASTKALISGAGTGVYFKYGGGGVTNFGNIVGSTGISLHDGGTVNNGAPGSTTATIVGTSGAGVVISLTAGTVVNFGTVESLGTSPAIVLNGAGGSVANGSAAVTTALITSQGSGIYIGRGPGAVTNFGNILSSSLRGNAVTLDGGGSLTNEGAIHSNHTSNSVVYVLDGGSVTNAKNGPITGQISGIGTGIVFRAGPGTVTNSGSIQSSGNTGVYLGTGGRVINVTGGLIAGKGDGIFARGAAATVSNTGAIQATAGNAIYLAAGGQVTNNAGGAITGSGDAVFSRGAAATVSNAGALQGGTFANAVYLTTGGSVTNQKGGVIVAGENGITGRGLPITVTNAGMIESTGTFSGVYLQGGGSVVNQTSATITGGLAGLHLWGPNAVTVTNQGVITGAIGVYDDPSFAPNLTVTNFATIASTAGTSGTALVLGVSSSRGLLVVEPGSTITGMVNGGGNGEVEFVEGGVNDVSNMFGFATIELANGVSHTLTLTDNNFTSVNFNHITVLGGNAGNTVTDSELGTSPVIFVGGAGADTFIGGPGNDIFQFTAAALQSTDSVQGNGGTDNQLVMTSPGVVTANGVTGVEIYRLGNGGPDSLSLVNNNFTGVSGGFIRVYGGNGNNAISALNVTNPGDQVVMYGGPGIDTLTGSANNDIFVFSAANLGAADTVAGGLGGDELLLTTSGTIAVNQVRAVETYVLASTGANTLTLANANFTNVTGDTIKVIGGNVGNTVDDSAVTGLNKLVFVGGPGADTIMAGLNTTVTGGGGANRFEFVNSAPATNTIVDFGGSLTNGLVFSVSGFALSGFVSPSATPQQWTTGNVGTSFAENTTGAYASASAGFNYNTSTGQLHYSSTGAPTSQSLVATLTGHPAVGDTSANMQLFFVS